MKKSPFLRMIADSDCPRCGGPVGSHSDICLDCHKDCSGAQHIDFMMGLLPWSWLIVLGIIVYKVCTNVSQN
jgi:hypothetical protein